MGTGTVRTVGRAGGRESERQDGARGQDHPPRASCAWSGSCRRSPARPGMLLSLSQWLLAFNPEWGFLRVFQYITFRSMMAAITALLIGLGFGRSEERRVGKECRS